MILTLIKTLTASSDSTLTFTHGTASVVLDGTYDEYMFVVTNAHPSANSANFKMNFSTDGHSSTVTKTTTSFYAQHNESAGVATVKLNAGGDVADGTGTFTLAHEVLNDADSACSGIVHLFQPANTTYVKHFYTRFNTCNYQPASIDLYAAGYLNTTSAINSAQFSFASGNIDAGVLQLYGIA